jgi:hypothetical protein
MASAVPEELGQNLAMIPRVVQTQLITALTAFFQRDVRLAEKVVERAHLGRGSDRDAGLPGALRRGGRPSRAIAARSARVPVSRRTASPRICAAVITR